MAEIGPFKISIIGDSTVGKSNFITKFTDNVFNENMVSTYGCGKIIHKIKKDEKTTIILEIWDTAGQERYRAIVKSMFQGSKGILLLYDITNQETFDNISNWANQIASYCEETIVILVGNKSDLKDKRKVSQITGEEKAKQLKMHFFETSAKTGDNVSNAFMKLTELLTDNQKQSDDKQRKNVIFEVTTMQEQKKSKCCK